MIDSAGDMVIKKFQLTCLSVDFESINLRNFAFLSWDALFTNFLLLFCISE